jgi:hypothetical protein
MKAHGVKLQKIAETDTQQLATPHEGEMEVVNAFGLLANNLTPSLRPITAIPPYDGY